MQKYRVTGTYHASVFPGEIGCGVKHDIDMIVEADDTDEAMSDAVGLDLWSRYPECSIDDEYWGGLTVAEVDSGTPELETNAAVVERMMRRSGTPTLFDEVHADYMGVDYGAGPDETRLFTYNEKSE